MPNDENEKQRKGLNKKLLLLLLTAFLLVMVLAMVKILVVTNPYEAHGSVEADYGFTGLGTQEDPYLISDLDDLCHFRDLVNSGTQFSESYFLQTADIDMTDAGNWTPIGEFGSEHYFYGSYNGDGHTLSNLTSIGDYGGLFGYLNGEVRNLGIESGHIDGSYVGAIASHGGSVAVISNCYNYASVHAWGRAAGIVDNFSSGRISYCLNFGEITCDRGTVGGISSYSAQATNCCSYQVPAFPDTFLGTATDVQQFTSLDEVSEWLNQIYPMLYEDKLNRDAIGKSAEQLCLLVKDGSTVRFDKSYSQTYAARKNMESFLADYGAILLLAAVALVMIAAVIRRPNASGLALTVFLVCVGFGVLNKTLVSKVGYGVTPMWGFYLQPHSTIDMLLLGSSRGGVNQDCEELWTDFGISGYNLWGGLQPAWNSYYFLNEALKYETPKVVVCDVSSTVYNTEYSNEGMQYANTYGMKLSLNKFSAIQVSAPQDRWMDLLLGFPIYHTRYSELTKSDFEPSFGDKATWATDMGSSVRYGTAGLTDLGDIVDAELTNPIPGKQEEYLLKIINKCKTEDIPLLLIASATSNRKYHMPFYNYIAGLAVQYDVPFIDFNRLDAETGITANDFWDGTHLNTNGTRKQSACLGQYLKENYGLVDHRGDPRYRSWDEFSVKMQNSYIALIRDSNDYLKELVRDDRTVVIIARRVAGNVEQLQQSAANVGFDMSFLDEAKSGCWVIEHPGNSSENTYYALNQDIALQLGDDTLSITPFSDRSITYAGQVLGSFQTGITCVVYDTNTKNVIHVRNLL